MSTLNDINEKFDKIPPQARNVYSVINPLSIRSSAESLIRAFGLNNVRVPDERSNQFDGKINGTRPPASTTNQFSSTTIGERFVPADPTRASKMSGMGGVPVFVDLVLTGPSGDPNKRETYVDNQTGANITIPTIYFEAVICTVDFVYNVMKTQIQGFDGTVKEYIGADDAKILIQGIIAGTNGVYPKDEVAALYRWINAPVSKGVVCPYLQNLGIDKLVVEDAGIPQIAGGYSYQTFTINCISDKPAELILL